MGKTVTVDFKAAWRLIDKMRILDLRNQTAVLKTGMSKATAPIVATAKDNVDNADAVDTGALRRSLTRRVKSYKDGDLIFAAIGPDTGYYSGGKRKRYGKGEGPTDAKREKLRRPAKYAHLVEFGHVSAEGYGPGEHFWQGTKGTRRRVRNDFPIRSFNGPRPFLVPAFEANRQGLQQLLAITTGDAMNKEFEKVLRK